MSISSSDGAAFGVLRDKGPLDPFLIRRTGETAFRRGGFCPAPGGAVHDITHAGASTTFRTIKPVTHTGHTPHIHVYVVNGETEAGTTQFNNAGHTANSRHRLFKRVSNAEAAAASMALTQGEAVEDTMAYIVFGATRRPRRMR